MAKVAFTKLSLNKNIDNKTFDWNGQIIEVKQYLPINEKLELISTVVNLSGDDNSFLNPMKQELFLTIEMIKAYTNITLTDKQQEDVCKLYDLFVSSGFAKKVIANIPEDEYWELKDGARQISTEIYKYKNSAVGIIETIATDYQGLTYDSQEIRDNIRDPESLELVKSILTKLG